MNTANPTAFMHQDDDLDKLLAGAEVAIKYLNKNVVKTPEGQILCASQKWELVKQENVLSYEDWVKQYGSSEVERTFALQDGDLEKLLKSIETAVKCLKKMNEKIHTDEGTFQKIDDSDDGVIEKDV